MIQPNFHFVEFYRPPPFGDGAKPWETSKQLEFDAAKSMLVVDIQYHYIIYNIYIYIYTHIVSGELGLFIVST